MSRQMRVQPSIDLVRISTKMIRDIDVSDHFFDSLREDYVEFNQWYARVAEQNRKAWIVSDKRPIDALCIFKEELVGEAVNDQKDTLPGRFLKLCTLKVAELGVKYGERLLFAAFHYCVQHGLTAVYVQVREGKHQELKDLLLDFGFVEKGRYRKDVTYVKDMTPGIVSRDLGSHKQRFEYARLHYPYHRDEEAVGKFFVAISATEHDLLFPDAQNQILAFPTLERPIVGEMNAIQKTFVCNVGIKALHEGDLLFFYQKGGTRNGGCSIECMGVVEGVWRYDALSDIPAADICRLPINGDAINNLISKANYVIIVRFRFIQRLERSIRRKELILENFEPNHRDVRQLPECVYRKLIKPRTSLYGVSFVDSNAGVRKKFTREIVSEVCGRLGVAFEWKGVSGGRRPQTRWRQRILLLLLALVVFVFFWWLIVR